MANRPKNIKRPWVSESKPFQRARDFSAFYNARAWRKVSKAYREAHPFCIDCEADGYVVKANVCDHKRGLGFLIDNNQNPYDWNELQSLCNKCHNKKSGKESHRNRGMG